MAELIHCAHCAASVSSLAIVCPSCGGDPRSRSTESAPPELPAAPLGQLAVELPGWTFVSLADGNRVELGRESPDDSIYSALAPFTDVSRNHATLSRSGDKLMLEDIGSEFGTWIDGIRIDANTPVAVTRDQAVRLGGSCFVRVTVHP